MRVGTNPLRSEKARKIKPVVLLVVTHLPNEEGYHAKRFKVIKQCLYSMTLNAGVDHSLVIYDNGSMDKFRDWVQEEIKPDIFIQSVNVGKTQARKMALSMLPPDTLVNYSDDDMLYSPNWLKPQLDLLSHFPNVSGVTGYVVRTAFRWGCENTMNWARDCGIMEAGRFLSDASEAEFCRSIGRDYQEHKARTKNELDYRATYKGVTAYLTAHHCQILGRAGVLAKASQDDNMTMGDEKPFDINLDYLGLRLGTVERLVRHIGNIPD